MSNLFFFQAEDGIRDIGVTGVQTCALPISAQFGRGVMTDVGNKLLGQFADKLAAQLGAGDAGATAAAATAPAEATPTQKVAATTAGAAEEVAASVEQVPGDNAVAERTRTTAAAARETAAAG